MELSDYAKTGEERLKEAGVPGISLSALNKDDLQYLTNYFKSKGYDVNEEKPITKDAGTIYPIIIFHKSSVEVKDA